MTGRGPRKAGWMELLGEQVIRVPRGREPGLVPLGPLFGGILLAVAAALFSSWVHVQTLAYGYRFSQAYRLHEKRRQIRDALEIERQMLRSPQRITRIAEEELGMVLPELDDRVIVR